jgi:hypothetical protein
LAGETEVLGGNLPQCRFVDHKPHMLQQLRERNLKANKAYSKYTEVPVPTAVIPTAAFKNPIRRDITGFKIIQRASPSVSRKSENYKALSKAF